MLGHPVYEQLGFSKETMASAHIKGYAIQILWRLTKSNTRQNSGYNIRYENYSGTRNFCNSNEQCFRFDTQCGVFGHVQIVGVNCMQSSECIILFFHSWTGCRLQRNMLLSMRDPIHYMHFVGARG